MFTDTFILSEDQTFSSGRVVNAQVLSEEARIHQSILELEKEYDVLSKDYHIKVDQIHSQLSMIGELSEYKPQHQKGRSVDSFPVLPDMLVVPMDSKSSQKILEISNLISHEPKDLSSESPPLDQKTQSLSESSPSFDQSEALIPLKKSTDAQDFPQE